MARDLVGGAGEAVALVHLRPARRQASGPAGAATAKNDPFGDWILGFPAGAAAAADDPFGD